MNMKVWNSMTMAEKEEFWNNLIIEYKNRKNN